MLSIEHFRISLRMNRKEEATKYRYPEFVCKKDIRIREVNGKRYFLKIRVRDSDGESILVILKNPSKATGIRSDKTVSTVLRYVYENCKKASYVTIVNLFPNYCTDSNKLVKQIEGKVADSENIEEIRNQIVDCSRVIVAWGKHPRKLKEEAEKVKKLIFPLLKGKKVESVVRTPPTENPLHGQVWSYAYKLKPYKISL